MAHLRLTQLNIYPIKSGAGLHADQWTVDDFGLCHDRRWMVIDDAGRFISQRERPRLALVRPSFGDACLHVDAPGLSRLDLPLRPTGTVTTRVTVWNDVCDATCLGEGAAGWFSAALGCSCSLVYMSDDTVRPAAPAFAPAGTRVSFSDGFPFLLISEESLADLNSRMSVPLPMNRFRPNLVIAGGEPYIEDTLDRFTIGEVSFQRVKPCDRCVITTTDQVTTERGREPLRTLSTYRKHGSKVLFGQNVVHSGLGRLAVGEMLRV